MKNLAAVTLSLFLALSLAPSIHAQESDDFTVVRFENQLEDDEQENRSRLGLAIDPLQCLLGYYPLSLQLAVFDLFKIELSAGLVSKPIIPALAASTTQTEAEYQPQAGFEVGLKYYPDEFVFDDSYYFGLSLKRLSYHYSYLADAALYQHNQLVVHDLSLVYGYDLPLGADNLYLDLYIGGSYRFSQLSYHKAEEPAIQIDPQMKIRPTLGVKVGYLIL